uniref:Phosphoglycerate mutase (2,3-diphosphoglycerate-dependent) n=1 Tax=Craspedostauros australis TaxID=1486917 RepID=A0A6T6ELV1_9STRA
MPEKVVLVRHGQSMGNINEALYATVPDNAMPLTDLGWEQARKTGEILKARIIASGETVHFVVSPYVRTVETFHGIVSAWCDPKEFAHIPDRAKRVKAWYRRLMEMGLTWNEDPRIREQDFGNYQVPEIIKKAKTDRHRFGVFYYRFQNGESASDVFDRVSTFLDSLWRNFDSNRARNYVLVTHGISIRVFLARYFRYTIDQFNMLANPTNCEMVVLGHNGEGQLDLDGRCNLELEKDEETKQTKVVGHRFHHRLRILPKAALRKTKIRISPDD